MPDLKPGYNLIQSLWVTCAAIAHQREKTKGWIASSLRSSQ